MNLRWREAEFAGGGCWFPRRRSHALILLEKWIGLLENVARILEHAEALLELYEDLLAHWEIK